MLNLTEASFQEKEVALVATNLLFDLPERPDIKALQKVIHKHIGPELQIEELYFGSYINVPDDEDPYFVIVYKRVYFEYINPDPDAEEEIVNFNDHKALAPLLPC